MMTQFTDAYISPALQYVKTADWWSSIFQAVDETVVARFYLALMLYRLWNQKTIWEVARRFQQPRGFIQNLLNGAAAFASCVSHYCKVSCKIILITGDCSIPDVLVMEIM